MNKLFHSLGLSCIVLACATSAWAQEINGKASDGEKKATQCIGCHGIVGYQASFPQIYHVPMIAGQSAKYLTSALSAYQKGDRKHPTMRGVSEGLSEQDKADLAAYYQGLGQGAIQVGPPPAAMGTTPVAELLKKGGCTACHGENFSKPIDPSYPKIAGQHADYLGVALKSYKLQVNSRVGRSNPIMAGVATQFSNAELQALADYIGALPSELKTISQNKFK